MSSVSSVHTMLHAATMLDEGARGLAIIAGPKIRAASGLRNAAAGGSIAKIVAGAEGVRALEGPFFSRMADDIISAAARAEGGTNVGPAIRSAREGASWILSRLSTMTP